jgi:hypothetical protein
MLAKDNLGRDILEEIVNEVDKESVRPFLRPEGWYQPERQARFALLRSSLLSGT